jgi:sec-independent protein translocase protein TatA
MLTGWERPSHWLVLAVVVLILFGYKKLPEMSRSVGRSLRIFKTEMKGMSEDDSTRDAGSPPAAADQPSTPQQQIAPNAADRAVPPTPQVPPVTPAAEPVEPRQQSQS